MMRRVDPDAVTDEHGRSPPCAASSTGPRPTGERTMTVDRRPRGHRPARRHLGPGRAPRPVRPAAARRRPVFWHPEPDDTGFWAVTKHADVRGRQPRLRPPSPRARRHVHPHPGRGGAGPAPPHDPQHGPAEAQPVPAPRVPGLHAPDDRRSWSRRSSAGPPRSSTTSCEKGEVRVRRGDRRPGPGADDLRDDRPRARGVAPDVRDLATSSSAPATIPTTRSPGSPRPPPMEIYALCDAVAADRRANPRDDIMTALVQGRGRRRAPRRRRAQPLLRHPGGGRQRDHPQPHQPLDAGPHRPPRPGPAAAGRPVAVGHRGRRDAPLGQLDPQLPPHRHPRHRAAGRADQRGRQGRHLLRVGQPRRGRVRRPAHASTSAAPPTTT